MLRVKIIIDGAVIVAVVGIIDDHEFGIIVLPIIVPVFHLHFHFHIVNLALFSVDKIVCTFRL